MKSAVIIMNLGTPQEPTIAAVRAFLKEFLSDPRVVEVPRLVWMIILYGFILTFRTPKVTAAYKKIWLNNGSPLRVITEQQVVKLQQLLANKFAVDASLVRYAMTYSGPSLEQVVSELEESDIDHILVLPLYPQYSATTTGSIYDQVAAINSRRRNIPELQIIKHYFDYPLYINALAKTVENNWQENGKAKQLIMSFHGVPQKYCDEGDPYEKQCNKTASLLAERLELDNSEWTITFQSRLGRAQWLTPYTADTLDRMGKESVDSVTVICPAFSVDCLETLEEINIENREIFLQAGGKAFSSVPCLNDNDDHIAMMGSLVEAYLPRV